VSVNSDCVGENVNLWSQESQESGVRWRVRSHGSHGSHGVKAESKSQRVKESKSQDGVKESQEPGFTGVTGDVKAAVVAVASNQHSRQNWEVQRSGIGQWNGAESRRWRCGMAGERVQYWQRIRRCNYAELAELGGATVQN
jgi:hypothetical protein